MLDIQQYFSFYHLDTSKGVIFSDPGIWTAYAGDYHKFESEEGETRHNVKKIMIHHKYEPFKYFSSYNLGKEQKIKQKIYNYMF